MKKCSSWSTGHPELASEDFRRFPKISEIQIVGFGRRARENRFRIIFITGDFFPICQLLWLTRVFKEKVVPPLAEALKIPNICSAASEIFGNRFGNRHFDSPPGWISCSRHLRRAQHPQPGPKTPGDIVMLGLHRDLQTNLQTAVRSLRKSSENFGNLPKSSEIVRKFRSLY